MENSNHTKSISLKHPFTIDGISIAETLKLRNVFEQIQQMGAVFCYAQKSGKKINVYLQDNQLFHSVEKGLVYDKLYEILQKEQFIVGQILGHDKIFTERYLLINLYYDFVAGNHNDFEINELWARDIAANMRGIKVPKATYVGKEQANIATQIINDTIEVEVSNSNIDKIVDIIDPKHDGSMTKNLNIVAHIPDWASQVIYNLIEGHDDIWLGPSCNADVLDRVYKNGIAKGRVANYRNNYDGTYCLELIILPC